MQLTFAGLFQIMILSLLTRSKSLLAVLTAALAALLDPSASGTTGPLRVSPLPLEASDAIQYRCYEAGSTRGYSEGERICKPSSQAREPGTFEWSVCTRKEDILAHSRRKYTCAANQSTALEGCWFLCMHRNFGISDYRKPYDSCLCDPVQPLDTPPATDELEPEHTTAAGRTPRPSQTCLGTLASGMCAWYGQCLQPYEDVCGLVRLYEQIPCFETRELSWKSAEARRWSKQFNLCFQQLLAPDLTPSNGQMHFEVSGQSRATKSSERCSHVDSVMIIGGLKCYLAVPSQIACNPSLPFCTLSVEDRAQVLWVRSTALAHAACEVTRRDILHALSCNHDTQHDHIQRNVQAALGPAAELVRLHVKYSVHDKKNQQVNNEPFTVLSRCDRWKGLIARLRYVLNKAMAKEETSAASRTQSAMTKSVRRDATGPGPKAAVFLVDEQEETPPSLGRNANESEVLLTVLLMLSPFSAHLRLRDNDTLRNAQAASVSRHYLDMLKKDLAWRGVSRPLPAAGEQWKAMMQITRVQSCTTNSCSGELGKKLGVACGRPPVPTSTSAQCATLLQLPTSSIAFVLFSMFFAL